MSATANGASGRGRRARSANSERPDGVRRVGHERGVREREVRRRARCLERLGGEQQRDERDPGERGDPGGRVGDLAVRGEPGRAGERTEPRGAPRHVTRPRRMASATIAARSLTSSLR